MTAFAGRRGLELTCALMAKEVVAGKDVIDLQALRACETLADVALEQAFAMDDARALAVAEQARVRGALTRLAAGGRLHRLARLGST